MKTKISHLGRSTVSVILAVMMLLSTMLIGTISVNAYDISPKSLYYANTLNWNTPKLQICKGNEYYYYDLTKIDNTNIYYRSQDWNGYTWFKFNDGTDYGAPAIEADVKSKTWYSGKSNAANTDFGKLNSTSKVVNMVSTDGNNYVEQSIGGTTVISGYNLPSGAVSATAVSSSTSSASSNASIEAAFGSTITYSAMADSNYEFKGFSTTNSSSLPNNLNTNATMTQTSSAINGNSNDVYYAYYVAKNIQTPVAESVKLTASSETVTSGGSTTLTATLTKKATGVGNVTYTFKTADGTEVDTVENTDKETASVEVKNITSDTTYTVTVSAPEHSDVTDTTTVTVKQLENWYIYGNKYEGGWAKDGNNKGNTANKLKYDAENNYYFINSTYTDSYFRFHNTTQEYGPNSTDNDEVLKITDTEKHTLSTNTGKAFRYYDTSCSNYRICLDPTDKNNIKVWVEENGKKYSITNNSGKDLTISPSQASAGETVTVTATPGTGEVLKSVTVVGKDGNPIETTVSGNTATFKMPDQNVTVKDVTFREAKTCTVTFNPNDPTFGTVSAKKGTTPITSGDTVTEGDEVTFTAVPQKGYALSGWKVNGISETRTDLSLSLKITANTTVVANFKVEDSGTIVNNMYFLYGSKDDPTKWEGMQAYDKPGYGKYNVYEKDGKYIVTLNKEHYKQLYFAFSKYDFYQNMVPNAGLIDVKSENPEGLSLVNAKIQPYNVYGVEYKFGQMNIVSENSDNIGEIKIIYDPTANTYTVKATKDSVSDTTVNIVGKDGTIRGGYYGKTTSALGDTTLKVTSPDNTTTITPIDSCNFDSQYQGVTAKKVPYGSTVTVTTTINPKANFAGHKGSDYYVKGFSINGFTGGVLTQQAGNAHESYVYEYTFTVNKDVYADVSTIEITPIYFLKNDSDCVTFYVENFMDAKAKWGDTIACYAYYSDGDTSGNALGGYPGQPMVNAEGSIYMQIPKHIGADASNVVKGITLNNYVWDFVHVSGDDKARESKNCQTYDYDDFKYLANMSKVNSSDSAADIKNIVYRFKYHTYNNTSAEAGNVPKGTLPETKVDDTKYEVFVDYYDKPTDIFGTIIRGNDAVTVGTVKEQKEYLTIVSDGYVNYYDNTTTYLGQYATKWYIYNKEGKQVAALPPSALLYGLTKSSTELENLVNKEEVPRDFMSDSGANTNVIRGYWTSFKSLYKNYEGKYAIINYESSIHSSGRDGAIKQPGERCDGRWYYSVDKAKITGDIRIEYADTLDSFTKMTGVNTDKFINGTAKGEITAAEAYFTSPAGQSTTDKPTHVETTSDNSENFKFTVGATSSTSYTFVGWYRLIDDTYKAVNDPSELNKTTGQVARNANVVLVARYIKTPGGSMTFNHSLYNGTNAGGGKATTEIQVVVKSSDGSIVYYDSGRIDSTASIDKKTINNIVTGQQDAKITVTLYTTTKNLYDFKGYYSAENKTDITAFPPSTADFTKTVSGDRKNGRVTTSVYTFSFNEYYNKYAGILTATDAGTVYYNFYSDITSIKVPYKVQFSYKDRMGAQKYYNKAGYVDPENTSSYTIVEDGNDVKVTLTDSFILSLAPYESNFTKNLTWDRPKDSKPFDSSLDSSIASAVVNSTQSPRTIHLNVFRDSNGDPTPRTNTAGAFKPYEKDGSFELPYGSVFYTDNGDGTYTYDITADKTYTDEDGTHQFMYWAIYSDPDFKNLVINAYNSEGHFSYVAYDNCWIVPVYEESSTPGASVKKVYTTTQFMEVTRNQWTADNADSFTTGIDVDTMTTHKDFNTEYGEDKLYADFVLNFFYNGKQLSTFDPNSNKVKAGVLIQRLELDRNETTGYITDLNHYANKKFTPEQLDDAKKDAIKKITTGNSVIPSVKQQINNSRLDNKNRLQYYTRFNNVEDNSDYVFRLYTYIQYNDADDQPVVELSNPVYFTFYDIANK